MALCLKSLSLNAATGDNPLDSACFNSTDGNIYGVRGSRVFRIDPTSGAILASSDYQQLGLSPSSICWDSGLNRLFAVCANTGSFDVANNVAVRNITRIVPSTLLSDLVIPISFTPPYSEVLDCAMQTGPRVIKDIGGIIYMLATTGNNSDRFWSFPAATPASVSKGNSECSYGSFAHATIGGNERLYGCNVQNSQVSWYDFTASSFGSGPVDTTHNILAIEFAPVHGKFYTTEEFEFIDIYDDTGTFVSQLDTARSAFNGVNIKFNSVDGFLYVAGGLDNTVAIINPATNAITIKTGFDLPWDFVFTSTKKFAVQQGSVGIKEIV